MFTKRKLLTFLAAGVVLTALAIGVQLAGAQYYMNPYNINPGDASTTYRYTIQVGTIAGGNYQLTSLCENAREGISGGSYRLLNQTSEPWGNCCCNFLPFVARH